jgi:hypothetical protein
MYIVDPLIYIIYVFCVVHLLVIMKRDEERVKDLIIQTLNGRNVF